MSNTKTNLLVLACVWDFLNKISGTIYWTTKIYASNPVLLKACLSTKRKVQSPWGFFPLKQSALTKACFKRTFLLSTKRIFLSFL